MGSESVCCELQYSRAARGFVVASATATAAIVLAMPWSASLRCALVAFVAAYAARALGQLRCARALRVDLDGRVRVERRDGSAAEGTLCSGGFVAPWLVCVRWRPSCERLDRTVVVLPDMLSVDDFRRLRILLRSA